METIVDVRDEHDIEPPAITVIGEVAATRKAVVDFLGNRTGELADHDSGLETTTE
jgi:uroporphyrin-III C-methyltransferase